MLYTCLISFIAKFGKNCISLLARILPCKLCGIRLYRISEIFSSDEWTRKHMFCIWRHCLTHIAHQSRLKHFKICQSFTVGLGDYKNYLIWWFSEFQNHFLQKLYMCKVIIVIFGLRTCVPNKTMFNQPVNFFDLCN